MRIATIAAADRPRLRQELGEGGGCHPRVRLSYLGLRGREDYCTASVTVSAPPSALGDTTRTRPTLPQ